MVKAERQFLVDTAFIVERTSKTFWGTPLLTKEGKDHTFTFGFVRELLQMRRDLGLRNLVLLIGEEAYSFATAETIEHLAGFLRRLGFQYIREGQIPGLNLAGALHLRFSHIVTADKRLLQLSKDDFTIVLLRQSQPREFDWLSPDAIRAAMGINPQQVPAYLSLTAGSKTRALYRKQAISLIQAYGDLDSIFQNLARVTPKRIRQKLQENERAIRDRFARNRVEAVQNLRWDDLHNSSSAHLDTKSNRELLQAHGFHSLIRLLGQPPDAPF